MFNKPNKLFEESLSEHLVSVSRVTKVVKGGRRFSFSACVILGNKAGSVGYGHGKAKEVSEARLKAAQSAKKYMVRIPLYQGRTIHYNVFGKSGAAKVVLRRAPAGTGVIAGGAMRSLFDSLGVQDIVAKSLGSSNPYSMIAATLNALKQLSIPKHIAERRGMKANEVSVVSYRKPKSNKIK